MKSEARLMSDLMNTFPILKIVEHGPGVKSFYFPKAFEIEPGQFINLWIPGIDEKPFSVSAVMDDMIEISAKAYGPFSNDLMQRKEGEYLGIRGPFGNKFNLHNHSLLIGGGIGIAPLRILARKLEKEGMKFIVLLGASKSEEIIFSGWWRKFPSTYFTTDDGSLGTKGVVTDILPEVLEKNKKGLKYIYAAGPEIMFVKVKEIIDKTGIPYEFCMERYMKCGIGICGQCVLDDSGIRLCVEGPVVTKEMLDQVTELGMKHRDASGRRV
jgi:dihydroorotate dehydrogenase electron transfer subunit